MNFIAKTKRMHTTNQQIYKNVLFAFSVSNEPIPKAKAAELIDLFQFDTHAILKHVLGTFLQFQSLSFLYILPCFHRNGMQLTRQREEHLCSKQKNQGP